jgi:hypothetical protein
MAIMEKYEKVIAYLYPIAQSFPRKHGVARDMFLRALLGQPDLFYQAGKTNQISRIYIADAGLAHLRFWLRFLTGQSIRAITPHQHQVASVLLAETGAMLGAWLQRQRKGQAGQ